MPTHPIKDLVYVTRVLRQELNYDFIFELEGHHRTFRSLSVAPKKSYAVYLFNLPKTSYEDEMVVYANSFGNVVTFRLSLDAEGVSQCNAYVTYATSYAASQCVKHMNGLKLIREDGSCDTRGLKARSTANVPPCS